MSPYVEGVKRINPAIDSRLEIIFYSDRAVIRSAKPLRSYLLADFIERYINKFILLLLYIQKIM